MFLLGPRATGKSTLIRETLGNKALVIDLLKTSTLTRLLENPTLLEEMIDSHQKQTPIPIWVVLDEVQKIPELLNEVHRLIEEKKTRFLLCGSSARRLKKRGVNLLAGRAWRAEVFPLTAHELGEDFDLAKYLRWGGLPRVATSQSPSEELDAYVGTYLKEEVLEEGAVRQLQRFSGFLRLAALTSGCLLNFERLSQEVGVSAPTIREYFSILQDTLLAFRMEPFQEVKKRRPVATSKIYLFDPGVTNFLSQIESLDRASDLFGNRFEQWVALELRAYLSYRRKKESLCFWRTLQGHEVDFVIGRHTAIEAKATRKVSLDDLKGLVALQEEGVFQKFILVSQDPIPHEKSGVFCIPHAEFIKCLWEDKLLAS